MLSHGVSGLVARCRLVAPQQIDARHCLPPPISISTAGYIRGTATLLSPSMRWLTNLIPCCSRTLSESSPWITSAERPLVSSDSEIASNHDKPPDICSTCWEGVVANQFGLLLPQGDFSYKTSEEQIKSGAKQGCRWCQILTRFASESFPSRVKRRGSIAPSEDTVEVSVGYSGYGSEEDSRTVANIQVNGRLCWFGYVYTTEDDPAAAFISGRNLFREVGSERAIPLAKELLQDCVSNHSDCPSLSEPYSLLPTRVVDCSEPSQPRLSITHGKRDLYIALSYVWGEAQPHKTTTQNIHSYMRSVDPGNLPPTILDAIQITHRLGIQYLWIDSLCIIQDSEEDKDHELTRMRNIYRDSYLTIVAASADRASEGFLQTRADTLGAAADTLPFVLPNAIGAVSLASWLYIRPMSKYDPTSEPVSKRGWCMQEYFLSRRQLVFAKHTLQYRCQKGTRNAGGADNPWWISSAGEPSLVRSLPESPKTCEEIEKVRKTWNATIENYTKRSISVPSDKFVAVSSLAEEFFDVVKSPYLAGLWECILLPGLLWKKESSRHHIPRPKQYRAPSWSWAAVDGEVDAGNAYFLDEKQKLIADAVRRETTLKNTMLPFGEVTAGTLVLRARVLLDCVMLPHWAVYRRIRDRNEPDVVEESATGQDTVGAEGINDRPWLRKPLVDLKEMQEIGYGQLDSSDEAITSGVRRISVVPVYCRDDLIPGLPSDLVVQGLIVERLDSGSSELGEMKYRRIGFFEGKGDVQKVNGWLESTPEIEIEIV